MNSHHLAWHPINLTIESWAAPNCCASSWSLFKMVIWVLEHFAYHHKDFKNKRKPLTLSDPFLVPSPIPTASHVLSFCSLVQRQNILLHGCLRMFFCACQQNSANIWFLTSSPIAFRAASKSCASSWSWNEHLINLEPFSWVLPRTWSW